MTLLIAHMADPGVVAGGDAGNFRSCIAQSSIGPNFTDRLHWEQAGCDPIAIPIHQPLDDFLLERLPRVHHMVRNAELFTDAGCIHQPLRATGPLPAHQPEGQALHLPARFHQQCRR